MVILAAIQGKTGVQKGAEQLEKLFSRQIIFSFLTKWTKNDRPQMVGKMSIILQWTAGLMLT
jgi:hypothetical protein